MTLFTHQTPSKLLFYFQSSYQYLVQLDKGYLFCCYSEMHSPVALIHSYCQLWCLAWQRHQQKMGYQEKGGHCQSATLQRCSSTGESGKWVQRNSLIMRKFNLWHSTYRWMNAEAQNDIPHAYTTFQLSLENFATYTQLSHFMTCLAKATCYSFSTKSGAAK